MTSEFSLIDKFFKSTSIRRADVGIGIGDDAAVTTVPAGMQLVTAVDTLVNDVHFPADTSAFSVGHKSLAVNLSDLAAMGAEPAWATLALTMPEADESWIEEFANGFFQLAEKYNVQLIGGDTTQGPLTVTVQVMGLIPEGKTITRGGAKPGDIVYVSGTLGDAAAALYMRNNPLQVSPVDMQDLKDKLNLPEPRVELGMKLRDVATSAIDVSDGLVADLGHVLDASGAGVSLRQQQLPLSSPVSSLIDRVGEDKVLQWVLQGGDDYELCFTAAEERRQDVLTIADEISVLVTEIGVIDSQKQIQLLNKNVCIEITRNGYQHFSKP